MLMHPRQADMQWRNQGRLSDFGATSGLNNGGLFADSFHEFEIEALAVGDKNEWTDSGNRYQRSLLEYGFFAQRSK